MNPIHYSSPAPATLVNHGITRLLIGSSLLVLFALPFEQPLLGSSNSSLFLTTILVYLTLHVAFVITASTLHVNRQQQAAIDPISSLMIVAYFTDISVLILVQAASSSVASSLTLFNIILVLTASATLQPRLALLVAATATLAILSAAIYRVQTGVGMVASMVPAGGFGVILFAVALLVGRITQRSRLSEQMISDQAVNIYELQQINSAIIAQLKTGVILVNQHFKIVMSNQAAMEFLDMDNTGSLPSELISTLTQFASSDKKRDEANFRTNDEIDTPLLRAKFAEFDAVRGSDTLILIDNLTATTELAQQMKLASLGRLTASIAHEIRNPLGAISHANQLLNESTNLDATERKMTSIIARQSSRMNQIIENVMGLSRPTSGQQEILKVDEYISQFMIDFLSENPDTQMDATFDKTGMLVNIDASQISQVLTNLCGNAIKHGNSDAPKVTLRISGNSRHTLMDVIDHGPGIPETIRNNIFEPFFTTNNNSTGLGLYICKQLCDANAAVLTYHPPPTQCFFSLIISYS